MKRKKELSKEEQKIKKFMKDFKELKNQTSVEWFLVGLFIFFTSILAFIPAQEIVGEFKEQVSRVSLLAAMILGIQIGMWHIYGYRSYNDGKNTHKVLDALKYRPVDFSLFRKEKMELLIKLYNKLLPVYIILQLLGSLFMESEISWINFAYIAGVFYLFPLGVNLLSVYLDK